jgi:hypothetical protein
VRELKNKIRFLQSRVSILSDGSVPYWQFNQMDNILLEKQLKWWMVLMINRSSVTFICNILYIYLHSYDIRLTAKFVTMKTKMFRENRYKSMLRRQGWLVSCLLVLKRTWIYNAINKCKFLSSNIILCSKTNVVAMPTHQIKYWPWTEESVFCSSIPPLLLPVRI